MVRLQTTDRTDGHSTDEQGLIDRLPLRFGAVFVTDPEIVGQSYGLVLQLHHHTG